MIVSLVSSLPSSDRVMVWVKSAGTVVKDDSPVKAENVHAPIKSIGNSTTTPRDLETNLDVKIILYLLAESVGKRLRENGVHAVLIGETLMRSPDKKKMLDELRG